MTTYSSKDDESPAKPRSADDAEVAFPAKPADEEDFERPVSWLVGRDLIAGLKWIALYTAFKGKLDPRDWMESAIYPSERNADAEECLNFWRERGDRQWDWKIQNDSFWAAKQEAEPDFWKRNRGDEEEEFWFDYISDSGDSQLSGYTVAYICLSDLWTEEEVKGRVSNETPEVKFEESAKHKTLLPRGQFLFVGGDTAYHIADYTNLSTRFQLPFRWAFTSLRKWLRDKKRLLAAPTNAHDENWDGRLPPTGAPATDDGKDSEVRAEPDAEPPRPLFGIPGNHDYYDFLHGFNKQFRRPAKTLADRGMIPQLALHGFDRTQGASYIAVMLPFDWWLWGLDTEVSKLDVRQQAFFSNLNEGRLPRKLIVATPEPAIVFRRQKAKDDEHALQAFEQLGFKQPPAAARDETTCRLDLSGDVHHYARYYGPETPGGANGSSGSDSGPVSDHYASVVAGGGGAFHHPTTTHVSGKGSIHEKVLYPPETDSRKAMASSLFSLRNIFQGGYVYLFGSIITAIVYFTLNVPQSTKDFLDWLFYPAGRPRSLFGWPLPFRPDAELISAPTSFPRGVAFQDLLLPTLFMVDALLLVVWAIQLFGQVITRLNEAKVRIEWKDEMKAVAYKEKVPPVATYAGLWKIALYVLLALGLFFAGVKEAVGRAAELHPFVSSLLVIYHFLLAAGLAVLSVQNSAWLAHRPKFVTGNRYRQLPVWLLGALAFFIVLSGVWFFGRFPASFVLSDVIFSLVALGILFGLTLVGLFVAGKYQKGPGKVLMTLAGFWHALLQLAVPLLLVRVGDWRALLLALVLLLVFSGLDIPWTHISVRGLGARVMDKSPGRVALPLLFFLYGAMLISLPFLLNNRRGAFAFGDKSFSSFLSQGGVDWVVSTAGSIAPAYGGAAQVWALFSVSLLAAVALGFLLSMSWLSWYFAVALAFHGHNNEAGGAARIEQFKHVVRIRLTRNELTAYVIAAKDAKADGFKLDLKLIDVFTLKVSRK